MRIISTIICSFSLLVLERTVRVTYLIQREGTTKVKSFCGENNHESKKSEWQLGYSDKEKSVPERDRTSGL